MLGETASLSALHVLVTLSSAAALPGLVGAGQDAQSPPHDPALVVSQKRTPERRFGSVRAVADHPPFSGEAVRLRHFITIHLNRFQTRVLFKKFTLHHFNFYF